MTGISGLGVVEGDLDLDCGVVVGRGISAGSSGDGEREEPVSASEPWPSGRLSESSEKLSEINDRVSSSTSCWLLSSSDSPSASLSASETSTNEEF